MNLIDKDAVVAVIERMMAEEMAIFEESLKDGSLEVSAAPVAYTRLQMLLSAVNAIEVKEVVRINTSLSDIDDDLKKLGIDPDSKQAKMLKDCYYRAIDRICHNCL